jgi:hypothetical protein
MQIWSGDEPIKTVARTNNKEVRKKRKGELMVAR